ncbi:MAG: type IX secretion system membrane protein PorP/SprF [Nonlabens sp.]|nr:type IX secretion system membrane protein PorP/SprF [Nonlabens sp.]
MSTMNYTNKAITLAITLTLMVGCFSGYAQQDAQYTQFMYNTVAINPAYAGNRGMLSAIALHRSQWAGLDGAPVTQSVSVHSPIGLSNVGLGFSVVNDKIGPASETYGNIDFSYMLDVGAESRLSFGLKAGGHVLNVDLQSLEVPDPNDPRFQQNIENKFSPNIGVGVYFHTAAFYIGASAPNLLKNEHFQASNNQTGASFIAAERVHYYLTSGYVFDVDYNIKLKPATMVKVVAGAPLQADFNLSMLYDEKLTVGASYRWSAALSGLLGYQINDQVMVGIAYDRETTDLGNTIFNSGSYEAFLRFELQRNYDRMETPRFF